MENHSLKINTSLLIGVDFTKGKDVGVMIVGTKKPGKDVEVINAFQGQEAYDLYLKLTTKKK